MPESTPLFAPVFAPAASRRYWIAVASADHVALGVADGFMQVCHGKAAPLRRLHPGDGAIDYSPTQSFGSKTPLQAFTALSEVLPARFIRCT
ncbi:MAG: EVE domain-containing protein [Brachymonas sp.]|nr:EVE domain-containing protein [Brachymonas sp.]